MGQITGNHWVGLPLMDKRRLPHLDLEEEELRFLVYAYNKYCRRLFIDPKSVAVGISSSTALEIASV